MEADINKETLPLAADMLIVTKESFESIKGDLERRAKYFLKEMYEIINDTASGGDCEVSFDISQILAYEISIDFAERLFMVYGYNIDIDDLYFTVSWGDIDIEALAEDEIIKELNEGK